MFNRRQWIEDGLKQRERVCILCGARHLASTRNTHSPFCPNCTTPQLKAEAKRVDIQFRRALSLGVPATLTLRQWIQILDHFNWHCAYCKTRKHELMEHIVSTTNGGGTTALNVVPACKTCNSNKDRVKSSSPVTIEAIEEVKQELKDLFNDNQRIC